MCEFKVYFNGKMVFEDAVYARANENRVLVRDILGETKEFENCRILEVNVNSVRLVLSPIEGSE